MKRRILIVDDFEVNRRILERILREDYEVLMAGTGAEALHMLHLHGNSISAVLLDIVMPVMNGYEFLGRVRSEERFSQLPIIVITQNDESDSEIKALRAGASDYVSRTNKSTVIIQRLKNLIRMHEAIENLKDAERDSLTGLYNKSAFYRIVKDRLEQVEPGEYAIVALDVEKFKLLNDTFGWEVGDRLLSLIARILMNRYEGTDRILGYGDRDIFLVMMRKDELDLAELEDFEREVGERFGTAKVTFKAGIYVIDDLDRKVRSMCDYAILAVNHVKGQYDVKYCMFEPSFLEGILLEKRITDIMQESLDNEDFKVYVQPKYDIKSGNIIGGEALVRWIHPQLGFLSPAVFIPIFEKNGFITRMDWFVWEKACQYMASWKEKYGKLLPISVNVSREDVYSPHFPEKLHEMVLGYGLEPKCLHLEVTETAYTENTKQLVEVIGKLKEYGFVIEMDDFGSGYSSLNVLAELPVDILKLDAKFMGNDLRSKNTNGIMRFIITLSRWMNLIVIAEGVETKNQVEYLKELGCNLVQGYYYSPPICREDFEKLISENEVMPIFDMDSYVEHVDLKRNEEEDARDVILARNGLELPV